MFMYPKINPSDIPMLYLPSEDHELTLVLRADSNGVLYYKLLGAMYVPEPEGDLPSTTEEQYHRILGSYGIYNDAPLTARSWADALSMLDTLRVIRWFEIGPYYIHPSIAMVVLQAVYERTPEKDRQFVLERWHSCISDTRDQLLRAGEPEGWTGMIK